MVHPASLKQTARISGAWLKPDLTVLMATYNGADTLPRTLTALTEIEEPPKGWKLVVIDDGSTDDTISIVNGFRGRLPLTVVQSLHGGKNAALNVGLREIEGDLVVFIDDDVLPERDWLVRLRETADRERGYTIFGGAIRPCWQMEPEPWVREVVRPGPVWGLIERDEGPCYHTLAFGGNMAVRAEVFRRGYRFNENVGPNGAPLYRIGSETELQFRLHRDGYLTWHCPSAIVRHIISQAEIDESWILRRAERFGRGQSAIGYDVPGRFGLQIGGVPLDIPVRMAANRIWAGVCGLFGCRKARLNAMWNHRFLRGVAHERRLAARAVAEAKSMPPVPGATAAMPKTVSVVISNYNYAAFVGDAIRSALDQTVPVHEVVVVDDGSVDGSREILESFRDDPRVHVIFQRNEGQASTVNRGFQASHGDLVIFLDADDMLRPEAVGTILRTWRPGASRCQFVLERIDVDGAVLGLHPLAQIVEHGDVLWKLVAAGQYRYMPTSGHAFARQALEPILPMPHREWRLCADTYLVTASTAFGPVIDLPEPLGFYRVHGKNGWYVDVIDESRMRIVWRQHLQVWNSLIAVLSQEDRFGANEREAMRRAHARLFLYRRIVAACICDPGVAAPKWYRDVVHHAIREALRSPVRWRWRLAYLTLFLSARTGAARLRCFRRWVSHRTLRPALVRRVTDWLTAGSFYGWMASADAPPAAPAFPIGRKLLFGIGQDIERHLWYGWERSLVNSAVVVGATATLVGQLPPGCTTLDAEMDVAPRLAGPVKSQRIEVRANGSCVYRGTLSEAKVIRFRIHQAQLRNGGGLILTIDCPDFVVPRLVDPASGDTKPQGVVCQWLRLRPVGGSTMARYPMLAVGRTVDLGDAAGAGFLDSGWHATTPRGARMARRYASLRFSVLRGGARDHILTLWFEREDLRDVQSSVVRIMCGDIQIGSVDLARSNRVSTIVPVKWDPQYRIDSAYGISSTHGTVTLTIVADQLLPLTGSPTGDLLAAAGPCLRRMLLEEATIPAGVPHFVVGEPMEFRDGGIGHRYLTSGWHVPDGSGAYTADVRGTLQGIVVSERRDIALSAVIAPFSNEGPYARQEVALEFNGRTLARCPISERAEVTAIIPREAIGADRLVQLNVRTNIVGRPANFGIGDEKRTIGVKLESLTIN